MFWLILNITLLYITMTNDKNIACAGFANVNVTLNLHSYEEN